MARAALKAYNLVRERVLSGEYAASTHLTEQQIADASGVSRTPVREALQRLQSDGLVRVIANHGAVVVDWSGEDAEDVFNLRALLEPYGAARAASRITGEGIEKLRDLALTQQRESERRRTGYAERISTLNTTFHTTLHEFAGSTRLPALLPMLIEAPRVVQTFSRYEDNELLRSAAHHLEIVAALEARDAVWAEAVMRSHVRAAQHSMQRYARDST